MLNKCLGPLYVLIDRIKAGKSHRSALQKGWWGGEGAFYLLDLSLENVFLESLVLCVFS